MSDQKVTNSDEAGHARPLQQTTATQNILYLEEQVMLQEATIAAWRRRRDHILVEQEKAETKKQQFLKQRSEIQERKVALRQSQQQNASLHQNLTESLLKSRERLQRLTTLEAMMEEQEGEHDNGMEDDVIPDEEGSEGDIASSKEADVSMEESEEVNSDHDLPETDPSSDDMESKDEGDADFLSSLPLVQDLNQFESLEQYHYDDPDLVRSSGRTLRPLLPLIDAKRIEEYLLLSQREGNALDCNNPDLSTSYRLKLLDNTCLDVFTMAERDGPEAPTGQARMDDSTTTANLLDPNLSLCPYELAGVCADDLCPYQHTVKEPHILARERLPLPILKEFPASKNGGSLNVKETESQDMDQDSQSESQEAEDEGDENDGDETREADDAAPLSNESEGEEEFMVLPPVNDNSPSKNDDGDEDGAEEMASVKSHSSNDDEASLPISGFSSNQANVSLKHDRRTSKFWWGGELPNTCAESFPSILSVLEKTFGLILHQTPNRAKEIRLEVVGTALSHDVSELGNGLPSVCKTIGKLVDATRLCVHSGRYDLAMTMCKALAEGRIFGHHLLWVEELGDALQEQIRKALRFDTDSGASLFELEFSILVNMTLISWLLRAVDALLDENDEAEENNAAMLLSYFSNMMPDQLEEIFCVPLFADPEDTASIEIRDLKAYFAHEELAATADPKQKIDRIKTEAKALQGLWQCVYLAFQSDNTADSISQRLDHLWSNVRNLFNRTDTAAIEDEKSTFHDSLKSLRELKVFVTMGTAMLTALSRLTAMASRDRVSDFSEWRAFDEAVHRILKTMSKEIRQTPMLHLVATPLHAASAAVSTFLRNYSTSQQRLENHLHPPSSPNQCSTFGAMPYCELLWSQLIQLRMGLPNEAPFVSNLSKPSKNKPWEPSEPVKRINRRMCRQIERTKIRLHHVLLFGNELLSTELESLQPLLRCASSDSNDASSLTKLIWTQKPNSFDETGISSSPNCSPLSPLPLSLLSLGHGLFELNLSHSSLAELPQSFGIYFPNVVTLDLSHNRLAHLPDSFNSLQQMMKSLQVFNLSHNQLESFPDEMFPIPGKGSMSTTSLIRVWNISHNRLRHLPPVIPVAFRHLEELWLDHNSLMDTTVVDLSRLAIKLPTLRHLSFDHQTISESE